MNIDRVPSLGLLRARIVALAAVSGLAALLILLTACGGGDSVDVRMTLDEWSVTPNVGEAGSGDVTFSVKNDGTRQHEMVIVKTDLAPDALPLAQGPQVQGKVEKTL